MRPTWHFVAPADIRWLQALTGPRVRAASVSVLRANELDARVLSRSRAAIARALDERRRDVGASASDLRRVCQRVP